MLTFCCHEARTFNKCFYCLGYQGSGPFSSVNSILKTINVPFANGITLLKSQCGTLNTSDDAIMPNTVCDFLCDRTISCGTTMVPTDD